MRLIDADALMVHVCARSIELYKKHKDEPNEDGPREPWRVERDTLLRVEEMIGNMPTMRGEHKPLQAHSGAMYCAACGGYAAQPTTASKKHWNYCPWCGSGIDWTGIEPVDIGPWLYRAETEEDEDETD